MLFFVVFFCNLLLSVMRLDCIVLTGMLLSNFATGISCCLYLNSSNDQYFSGFLLLGQIDAGLKFFSIRYYGFRLNSVYNTLHIYNGYSVLVFTRNCYFIRLLRTPSALFLRVQEEIIHVQFSFHQFTRIAQLT